MCRVREAYTREITWHNLVGVQTTERSSLYGDSPSPSNQPVCLGSNSLVRLAMSGTNLSNIGGNLVEMLIYGFFFQDSLLWQNISEELRES